MNRLRIFLSGLAIFLLAGCSEGVFTPNPEEGNLRLEASISKQVIHVGDTATLLLRLRNLGSEEITLNFNSTCQILPYIHHRRSSDMVHPAGGGWVCGGALTSLTLAPGGERMVPYVVGGGAPAQGIHMGAPLPEGEYVAYARVQASQVNLTSLPVSFAV